MTGIRRSCVRMYFSLLRSIRRLFEGRFLGLPAATSLSPPRTLLRVRSPLSLGLHSSVEDEPCRATQWWRNHLPPLLPWHRFQSTSSSRIPASLHSWYPAEDLSQVLWAHGWWWCIPSLFPLTPSRKTHSTFLMTLLTLISSTASISSIRLVFFSQLWFAFSYPFIVLRSFLASLIHSFCMFKTKQRLQKTLGNGHHNFWQIITAIVKEW